MQSIGVDLLEAFGTTKLLNNGLIEPPNLNYGAITADQFDRIHRSKDYLHLNPGIQKAIESVVLITVGDGAWASGVLINDNGLILTNAHLIEPWRFGKTQFSHSPSQNNIVFSANTSGSFCSFSQHKPDFESMDGYAKSSHKVDGESSVQNVRLQHMAVRTDDNAAIDSVGVRQASEFNYRSYRKIRVRIEHPKPRTWYDARAIYISRGPLDVALLQIETFPPGLQAMQPEEECPIPGAPAIVIGHGLFVPRSGDLIFT